MIKLLTFSTLYPSSVRPNHGIFVETRLRKLLDSEDIESVVIAPVPWFPFINQKFGDYAKFARTPREESRNGIRVLHPRYPLIPKIGMSIAPFLLAAAMRPVIRDLIEGGYDFDIIDAHYFYPDGVAAVLLGRFFKKPVTVTARGTDINLFPKFFIPRRMILWAARNTSKIITVCQALKASVVNLGIDANKIVPLRNGVDLKLFHPIDRDKHRNEMGLRYFTILSVGNLIEIKGHELILEALADLPDVELLIAGSGPDRKRLEILADKIGVRSRVRFLGAVPQSELPNYYGVADALVLASSREGLANVLLESMACGTPVIATNVGGAAEVLDNKLVGLLMQDRTSSCIVQSIRELRSHYPDRKAIRNYAERYGWEATTHGQLELFGKILNKR